MTRVWRNSAGEYNWYDFEYTARAAAVLAGDMGLLGDKIIVSVPSPGGSSSFGAARS